MVLDLAALKKFGQLVLDMHKQVPTLPAVVSLEEKRSIRNHLESLGFYVTGAIQRMEKGQGENDKESDRIASMTSATIAQLNSVMRDKARADLSVSIIDDLKNRLEDA